MPARPIRAGFAAASLLCLVLGAACSSTNDRDDDDNTPDAGQQQTDAGDQTDGGDKTDGGNEECPLTTDCAIAACDGRVCGNGGMCSGGACVEPTQIGEACSGATASNEQGTCSAGQLCTPLEFLVFSRLADDAEERNTCTKTCVTDADCGQTNGIDNTCFALDATNSLCVKGCDPSNPTGPSCEGDSVCLSFPIGGKNTDVCVAPCEKNADCRLGMTCSRVNLGDIKVCNPDPCPAGGICGEGRACQTFGQQKLCIDACSDENPCAEGLTCDTGSGLCKAHAGTYYQVCNNETPCPEDDAECISNPNGGSDGICMQKCAGSVCGEGDPAGTVCAVQTTAGDSMCALPCSQGTTCPTGTTCASLGGPETYCLP